MARLHSGGRRVVVAPEGVSPRCETWGDVVDEEHDGSSLQEEERPR